MAEHTSIVVTSIFEPNTSLREIARGASINNWHFLIVGDSKSPKNFHLPGSDFFDLNAQQQLPFKLAKLCPVGHYTRKNIGYLLAIKDKSTIIIETDDDNLPLENFWEPRTAYPDAQDLTGQGWTNVYSYFSEKHIWPRGLPLENILPQTKVPVQKELTSKYSPIQQGLADGNPDVDAVFRMTQTLPIKFDTGSSIRLQSGLWSPFNSQNTTWYKEAFPLLYLPSYCTFRMTDIWRSFVAQRIAWECGWQIVFHKSTVFQERNEHNLLKDFEQEIPGYLLNNKIKSILENAPLKSGVANINYNLRVCYGLLVEHNIINSSKELELLDAWLQDLEKL